MTWLNRSYGAYTQVFNANMTPTIPGSPSPGDLLVLHTGMAPGTISASPTIPGWQNLSAVAGETSIEATVAAYGRIYTGAGDTPTFRWTGADFYYSGIHVYRGGPASLSGILAVAPTVHFNNVSSNTIEMPGQALASPADDGSLLIALGVKLTGLSAAPAWGTFSGFTLQKTVFLSGQYAAVYGDWIQATATSVSAASWPHATPNDAVSENNVGRIITLLPAAVTPSPSRGSVSLLGCGA